MRNFEKLFFMRKLVSFLLAGLLSSTVAWASDGALRGRFTINAAGDQIVFSQGSLQFNPQAGTHAAPGDPAANGVFRFANNQWQRAEGIHANLDNWFDTFQWGIANDTVVSGTSQTNADFVDFGTHAISNGGDAINTWRTLTAAEWHYLFIDRPNAQHLFGVAKVNEVVGVVILPDRWSAPVGSTFMSAPESGMRYQAGENFGYGDYYTSSSYFNANNTYSGEQWAAMEAAGAVFLPGTSFWSSTLSDFTNEDINYAHYYYFYQQYGNVILAPTFRESVKRLSQVRLVQAATLPDPEPAPVVYAEEKPLTGKFSVNEEGKTVVFAQGNLQYNAYADQWQFAENQWDNIGQDNRNISPYYAGWIDLFCWGTGDRPLVWAEDSVYNTFVDWGTNAIANGGNQPNQWYTMSKDEWHYLLFERENSSDLYKYVYVHNAYGIMLLPDNFYLHADKDAVSADTITDEQWTALEALGAVFMPHSYRRYFDYDANKAMDIFNGKSYWTSTDINDDQAFSLDLYKNEWYPYEPVRLFGTDHNFGLPVRLAKVTARTYDLEEAVSDARETYNDLLYYTEVSGNPAYAEVATWLLPHVEEAEALLANPDASQEAIDATAERLDKIRNQARFMTNVNEMIDYIKEQGFEEVAADFETAVQPYLAVLQNPDATEEEIEAAMNAIYAAAEAAEYAMQHWDVENVHSSAVSTQKVFRDGMLFIHRNGKTYNAIGTELK